MAAATKIKYIKSGFQQLLSLEQFRLLFRYCAMAFVGNIIYFLLYRVDYWFVENYCTPEQLGNYIQVSKLGHLFLIVPTILASAVFPITSGSMWMEPHCAQVKYGYPSMTAYPALRPETQIGQSKDVIACFPAWVTAQPTCPSTHATRARNDAPARPRRRALPAHPRDPAPHDP